MSFLVYRAMGEVGDPRTPILESLHPVWLMVSPRTLKTLGGIYTAVAPSSNPSLAVYSSSPERPQDPVKLEQNCVEGVALTRPLPPVL